MEIRYWSGSVGVLLLTRFLTMVVGNIENLPEFLVEDDEIDCADANTPTLSYVHVPWNIPHRAFKTLPSGLRIEDSTIENAGLGVYSDTFIKKHTWLAEYEGEIVIKLFQISDYAWKVKRNGKKSYYVDAHDIATSNWVRWINCSRNSREENVEVRECKGRMYYVTIKDIYPGEELLVYYGDGYAKDLHIDIDNYDNYPEETSSYIDNVSCDKNCSGS